MMLLPVCLGRDMDMEPKRVNNLAGGRRATYRAQTEPELPTCCSLEIFIDRLIGELWKIYFRYNDGH